MAFIVVHESVSLLIVRSAFDATLRCIGSIYLYASLAIDVMLFLNWRIIMYYNVTSKISRAITLLVGN